MTMEVTVLRQMADSEKVVSVHAHKSDKPKVSFSKKKTDKTDSIVVE